MTDVRLALALTLVGIRLLVWFIAPFLVLAALTITANLMDQAIDATGAYLLASSDTDPRP